MDNLLKSIPNMLFLAYVTKAAILGCSLSDSLIILTICGYCIIHTYYTENKKITEFEKKLQLYQVDIANLNERVSKTNDNVGKMGLNSLMRK